MCKPIKRQSTKRDNNFLPVQCSTALRTQRHIPEILQRHHRYRSVLSAVQRGTAVLVLDHSSGVKVRVDQQAALEGVHGFGKLLLVEVFGPGEMVGVESEFLEYLAQLGDFGLLRSGCIHGTVGWRSGDAMLQQAGDVEDGSQILSVGLESLRLQGGMSSRRSGAC